MLVNTLVYALRRQGFRRAQDGKALARSFLL